MIHTCKLTSKLKRGTSLIINVYMYQLKCYMYIMVKQSIMVIALLL